MNTNSVNNTNTLINDDVVKTILFGIFLICMVRLAFWIFNWNMFIKKDKKPSR